MTAAGFNPMRWNCHKNGKGENCFNLKRRPKIETFSECFPRRINFGDVDGLVEINGKFCLLEWKGDGGAIGRGQHLSYVAFTKSPGNVVIVVHGNAETMNVRGYGYYLRGTYFRMGSATLDDVKDFLRRWVSCCEQPSGYDPAADLAGSLNDCYAAVKERMASGGPAWPREDQ